MESDKESTVTAILTLLRQPVPLTALTAILHRDVDQEAIIAGIKPKVANHLIETTTQLGLTKRFSEDVLFCFVHLVMLEEHGKHQIRTDNERRASLKEIVDLCSKLSKVLRSLDSREAIAMSLLERNKLRPWADPDAKQAHVLAGFGNIEALEKAARWMRDQVPRSQGGRKPLLKPYAMEVARLWRAVEPSGVLKLGRGGNFEHLCNELFKAARVPAKAEGAIRYFQKYILGKPQSELQMIADLLEKTIGPITFPGLNRRKIPEGK